MEFLDYIQNISENAWVYGGSFILVLGVLVFIHELGHYLVARMCGVHVEEFSIGFGPEIAGWNDKSNTRWKISLLPLGGYVKMYGDTDPASATHEGAEGIPEGRRSEAFFAKSVAQRAAIVFAGPAINYLYAVIVMALVFTFHGKPSSPTYASSVIGGSAAEKAGFLPYDDVIAINGSTIDSFDDIRRSVMVGLGDERVFTILREGQEIQLTATPDVVEFKDRFGFSSSRGVLGITGAQHALQLDMITEVGGIEVSTQQGVIDALNVSAKTGSPFWVYLGEDDSYLISPDMLVNGDALAEGYLVLSNGVEEISIELSFPQALVGASESVWNATTSTLHALGQMVTGARSTAELGGLIRIGAMAGDVAQRGFIALLMFSALLSINLGLINLFPIPVLDGGHLVFYAIEAVIGKPVPEKAQDYAFRTGFGFLIVLMAFANINDIIQLFS